MTSHFHILDYAAARLGGIFDEFEQDALDANNITSDELHRWRTSLEQADAEGVFFSSVSQVMLAGRRI